MKVWARVLAGLGVFLIVAGVLAVAYAPGAAKKTPLDVNTVTMLDGTAARLDAATGDFTTKPVYVRVLNQVDSKSSDGDTDVFVESTCAVFVSGESRDCVDGNDPTLIAATLDTFAENRVSALTVSSSKLPRDAVPHDGLVNKWPFDAQKKTYPLWDSTISKAVPATYQRTSSVDGVSCYVYRTSVNDAPIQIGEGISGSYSDTRDLCIEPRTGAILNQVETQHRVLADGTPALDLDIAYTAAQQRVNADLARSNVRQLTVLLTVVPIIGFVGGALALIGAFLLLRTSRRRRGEHSSDSSRALVNS